MIIEATVHVVLLELLPFCLLISLALTADQNISSKAFLILFSHDKALDGSLVSHP